MMDILFRGKRIDNGAWVEGYYCPYCFARFPCLPAIVPKREMDEGHWHAIEVDPETVGQYTGLTDKNGKKIFEGDVLKAQYDDLYPDNLTFSKIVWHDNGWCYKEIGYDPDKLDDSNAARSIVAGNIYDNPELLKGE